MGKQMHPRDDRKTWSGDAQLRDSAICNPTSEAWIDDGGKLYGEIPRFPFYM